VRSIDECKKVGKKQIKTNGQINGKMDKLLLAMDKLFLAILLGKQVHDAIIVLEEISRSS